MILPDTQHVSLRNVILWIAYGDAEPPNDYAGNELWFSKEKEIKDARSAAWSALENGTLEASAIGPDRAPTLIGKHEWQYLIGRSMPAYIEGRKPVTVPRAAILATWPPRSLIVSASPGRPSIMNEIEAELDRWIKGGFPV